MDGTPDILVTALDFPARAAAGRAAPEEAPRFHGCPERIPGSLSLGRRLVT
jgi:hypothetical protein